MPDIYKTYPRPWRYLDMGCIVDADGNDVIPDLSNEDNEPLDDLGEYIVKAVNSYKGPA